MNFRRPSAHGMAFECKSHQRYRSCPRLDSKHPSMEPWMRAGYVRVDFIEKALAWQRLAESPEPAPGDPEPSTSGFRSEVPPPPRMHKVYMGCLENKGGFRPIRDPHSKWFISEGDMPDSKVTVLLAASKSHSGGSLHEHVCQCPVERYGPASASGRSAALGSSVADASAKFLHLHGSYSAMILASLCCQLPC